MNTFGISIPGLRIAGGLIVAFIGFRMLFPQQKAHESPEAHTKAEELEQEPDTNIAFVRGTDTRSWYHCDDYPFIVND